MIIKLSPILRWYSSEDFTQFSNALQDLSLLAGENINCSQPRVSFSIRIVPLLLLECSFSSLREFPFSCTHISTQTKPQTHSVWLPPLWNLPHKFYLRLSELRSQSSNSVRYWALFRFLSLQPRNALFIVSCSDCRTRCSSSFPQDHCLHSLLSNVWKRSFPKLCFAGCIILGCWWWWWWSPVSGLPSGQEAEILRAF